MVWSLALAGTGCLKKQGVEQHFYENHIQPIFNSFCINNTSPCHRVDPATGVALGNLDLTSFENVQKRRDVLRTLRQLHAAAAAAQGPARGAGARSRSAARAYLERDPARGRQANLVELGRVLRAQALARQRREPRRHPARRASRTRASAGCNTALPPRLDAAHAGRRHEQLGLQRRSRPTSSRTLKQSCAFSTCHSSPQSDFYLTCGDTPENQLFNYVQAASFVVPAPAAVEQSEILLRPLSVPGGGINHTGGVFFQSRKDETWLKCGRAGPQDVQANPLPPEQKSMGRQFFEANVLPKLVTRGCALEGCHSPDGFNDFRLRPGAQGFLSPGALKRDYETTLLEFMALDSVDVRQSRVVKKTTVGGITAPRRRAARGRGREPRTCRARRRSPRATTRRCRTTPTNPATARAFCVLKEWHRIERMERASSVSAMAMGDDAAARLRLAPAQRRQPACSSTPIEGGADLKLADATMGADGARRERRQRAQRARAVRGARG